MGQPMNVFGWAIDADHAILSQAEQASLAVAYQAGDQKAGDQLVAVNVRLVISIVAKMYGDMIELFAEGMCGLVEAAQRYEPSKGTFTTYASLWVRSRCLGYLMDRTYLIKPASRNARRLFWKERSRDPILDKPVAEQEECLDFARIRSCPVQLDHHPDPSLFGQRDADPSLFELRDADPNPEDLCIERDEWIHQRAALKAFGASLKGRDAAIFHERLLGKAILSEIGDRFGISKERVRQLQESLMVKLRRYVVHQHPREVQIRRRKTLTSGHGC